MIASALAALARPRIGAPPRPPGPLARCGWSSPSARRRQRHRRAADRARAGRAAGPARGHREQARRRLDHRRRAGGAGARRRLHAAHVELGAAVDLARADARPRLRRAGQLRSPGLYRRGAHRLRRPSVRARRHVGRADRLDQGPGPACAVRQRRPGLGRPDRRRTLCARHRRAAAHSVQGSGAMRNDLLGGQIRSPWTRCRRTCPICAPASCGCWPSPPSGACRRRRTFPPWANWACRGWWPRTSSACPARRACRRVRQRLHAELTAALREPALREKLAGQGFVLADKSPPNSPTSCVARPGLGTRGARHRSQPVSARRVLALFGHPGRGGFNEAAVEARAPSAPASRCGSNGSQIPIRKLAPRASPRCANRGWTC